VHSYTHLRKENVLGTRSILSLCNLGKPKTLVFVSSASVLDTAYYMEQSQTEGLVLEGANLEESKTGLPNGYAQTKWVSEQLVTEAIRRGLQATIVRPGYVVGDSNTGGIIFLLR
jgi:L-aminoadipate-semialdehyde dehydrogenase